MRHFIIYVTPVKLSVLHNKLLLILLSEVEMHHFVNIISFSFPTFSFSFHAVPPKFIVEPERLARAKNNSEVSLSCQAIGFPKPDISWSRRHGSLPRGRTSVINGTMNISSFNSEDYGTYQCKATNKLGSVTALTTFPGKNKQRLTK